MFSYRRSILGITIITLLGGCPGVPAAQSQATAGATAPAQPPRAPAAPRVEQRRAAIPADAARAADRALADLAQRLGVAQTAIEVLGVLPDDGAANKRGWRVRLGAAGEVYHYQVDPRGALKRLPGR